MDFTQIEQFGATSWCEGIVGDGCGGGRIFFTCKDSLNVYDPITKKMMTLLQNLQEPQGISKKGCHLLFTCKQIKMIFDLSKMSLIED
ncbi:MAG: thiamine biosynthesis protein ThiF [Thiovulaceae bacterium]|nr:thiamine biosynthesis protein ThiF [Sulfurimonadaceae bacterium]